ncbi:serine/threonine-protein kinase [Limnobacter sp. MED105]|uniref:serine/threonine protein kinase n=1 Tax=Limnobacter sp. MED105 TaxID=391597 RepID=UPI000156C60B|nr:serine/threonine-protein kinase [Limnobacter sp. MED105]EDM84499.1 serine/threonine protein kinase [Limnobacter sp. MED105]
MMNENTVIQAAPVIPNDSGQQPLPVGTRIEGFEIQDVIGVGGFGIVYKALDPMLERQVALKEYLPASLAQRIPGGAVKVREARHKSTFDAGMRSFINEARLLAQFDHAALVKVYRFWEMAGTAYMVMPLYQGMNLKQYAENHAAPLAQEQLVNWLLVLTEALEVMHSQQCYHRDISPENIIIQDNTDLPILLDFGAARRAIGSVSQPFTVILKASYAPIEQYAEVPSMTQGAWTDVYALAAVAHFLMTGKTPPSSVGRLVNDSYLPLHERLELPYSPHVKKAIDHALAVQPQDRTASMSLFRQALQTETQDILSLYDQAAHPQPETRPKRSHLIRPMKLWGPVIVATIAVTALVATFNFDPNVQLMEEKADTTKTTVVQTDGASAEPIPISPELTNNLDASFQAVIDRADSALNIEIEQTVLKIGVDLLRFQIQSQESGFVAVYVRGSDKSLIQLLPNARVPVLSIGANKPLQLPPNNEPIQAAGPAGENQFLVVVTEQPRNYEHLNFQDHYGFGLIQADQGKAGSPIHALEGISPCANGSCIDRLAAAWFSLDAVD